MVAPLEHMITCFNWKDAVWQFALGISIGSFLNVLALRTLAERNPFWGHSRCLHCDKTIGFFDLIPIASYMLLMGRCRSCKEKISWQYPFVELVTGIMFVVILQGFGTVFGVPNEPGQMMIGARFECQGWGMVFFVSVMIALCITDFREKLLPHEITYPSMLVGLLYSALTRSDGLRDSLVGIGISYILFDFLAFYGSILYRWMRGTDEEEGEEEGAKDESQPKPASWFSKLFASQSETKETLETASSAGSAATTNQAEPTVASTDPIPTAETAVASTVPNPAAESTEANPRAVNTEAVEHALDSGFVAKSNREVDAIGVGPGGPIKFANRLAARTTATDNNNHLDDVDAFIDRNFEVEDEKSVADELSDDFEVMGGGDAVLAAVISAWLGMSGLSFTLLGGFLLGTVMGCGYLLHEMKRHGVLARTLRCVVAWSLGLSALVFLTFYFAYKTNNPSDADAVNFSERMLPFVWPSLAIASTLGAMLGILQNGQKYSKPFPFGPALAIAAIVSIFWNPFNIMPDTANTRLLVPNAQYQPVPSR